MNTQSLNISRALTFMFEEDNWVTKFLIGSAIILSSYFLFLPYALLQGYVIELIRRVSRDQSPALPEWENLGKYFVEGFLSAIAYFIYLLPAFLPLCFAIPVMVITADQNGGDPSGAGVLLLCCAMIAMLLFIIPASLLYFAGLMRYAETSEFSSFFQFGRLWSYTRNNLNSYGTAVIIAIVASFVGGMVPVLGQVWAQYATGHLLGQVLGRANATASSVSPFAETPL